MNKVLKAVLMVLCLSAVLVPAAFAQEKDVKGSKDHPLLSRMPNFFIQDYEFKDFDQIDFLDEQGNDAVKEGRKTYISYYIKSGFDAPSDAAILRNYRNALVKIGGKTVYEGSHNAYLRLDKNGATTWVHVRAWNDGEGCDLTIVEEAEMQQDVVADASAMAEEIRATGRVALYGILFDTNKTEIKPESEAVLKEISELLKRNPQLKLHIVGHTDNVGSFEANLDLSKRRAESVLSYLVARHNIDSGRLKGSGVGPLAPVASNTTEEGRARNRRVELVEQ